MADKPANDRILSFAQKNNADGIKAILAEGCPIDHANRVGQTALHIAMLWGNTAALSALLDAGPEPEVLNLANKISGATPLHCAANSNKPLEGRIKCVEMLVAAGADVNAKDTYGSLPVDYTESAEMRQFLGARDLTLHKRLKDGDFDLDVTQEEVKTLEDMNSFGESVFHLAARLTPLPKAIDALGCLVERSSTVAAETDNDGKTWLHHLIEVHSPVPPSFDLSPVSELIAATKISVNHRQFGESYGGPPTMGDTALHLAFRASDVHLSSLLASCGATAQPGSSDESLLDVAFSSSPPDLPLAALAIETGCEVDPVSPSTNGALHKSAQKGYAEACTFLISHGADPNRPGRQNFTPTILACRSCKVEAVKALVEGGGRWRDEGGKDG
eukprot:CAMPEP_0182463836 /NCGR_PEP_ID=MMETSP1319-20130603/8002_1 /TAXON_ID=172717 /ORGANISM="Bolidomonas pacifica, Strain RCC208" /LENGTH=387 /DNA_ID=CAMNT_0024663423 /DNA_START=173 /DNA_END=1332 /DNA_ORIENTATION=-